jgi:hypothetical protein
MAPIKRVPLCAVQYALEVVEGSHILPEELYVREPNNPYDAIEILEALPGMVEELQAIEIRRQSLCVVFMSEKILIKKYMKIVIVPGPDYECDLGQGKYRAIAARDDRAQQKRENEESKRADIEHMEKVMNSSGPHLANARLCMHASMRLAFRENVAFQRRKETERLRKIGWHRDKRFDPSTLKNVMTHKSMAFKDDSMGSEDESVASVVGSIVHEDVPEEELRERINNVLKSTLKHMNDVSECQSVSSEDWSTASNDEATSEESEPTFESASTSESESTASKKRINGIKTRITSIKRWITSFKRPIDGI